MIKELEDSTFLNLSMGINSVIYQFSGEFLEEENYTGICLNSLYLVFLSVLIKYEFKDFSKDIMSKEIIELYKDNIHIFNEFIGEIRPLVRKKLGG